MIKRNLVVMFLLCSLLVFAACASDVKESEDINKTDEVASEEKEISSLEWSEVLEKAKGQVVDIHMWGGSEYVNSYMDDYVAKELKDKYDITLNRVPVTDIRDVINKLLVEKEEDKTDGTVDLLWLNGENFKLAKENDILYGELTSLIPNYIKYVNLNAEDLNYDFGYKTEGYEIPFGKAQFVMVYNSEKIANPPKSMEDLKTWIKENPGRFTYPSPPDFTGSACVRNVMYETSGGYEKYLDDMSNEEFNENTAPLWAYLNDIEENLWRNGETYPASSAILDQLFASGEVDMTMSYNPVHASNMIASGSFPESTRSFVFDNGSLSNTHYLSMPFNCVDEEASVVVLDFLLSPEAQAMKNNPEYWGDFTVLDFEKLNDDEKLLFEELDLGKATLSTEELASKRLPEISSEYVNKLEKGWLEEVVKK